MVVSLNSSHICTQTYLIVQPVCPYGLWGDLIPEKRPASCVQDRRPLTNRCVCPEHAAAGMLQPPWLIVLQWALQKVPSICLSGYSQGSCTALFEIFNLIWGCLRLPEVILVIYKRDEIWSYKNLSRMIKRSNGNPLICCLLFCFGLGLYT